MRKRGGSSPFADGPRFFERHARRFGAAMGKDALHRNRLCWLCEVIVPAAKCTEAKSAIGTSMTATNRQKQKVLCLMRILEQETDAQHGLTMPQIIERLEEQGVSAERKSIYRDIQALRDIGFEIRKIPARPVQYALSRTNLSFDDVMMLVDIVQSSRFITERKSNQLVKSLKELVSVRERKLLDKRVHVSGRVKSKSESVFNTVDLIHKAMQQKRQIQFLYYSFNTELKRVARHGGKQYELTPAKVIYADNYYYLAAYDDEAQMIKTYRVDRMELPQISDKPATRCEAIANYEYEDFAYRSFGMFHGEPVRATLRVESHLMDVIVDRFGRDVEVVEAAPDHAVIVVNVRKSPQFFGWIAGLDGGVAIQTPQRLAAEYKEWLIGLIESS